MATTFIKPQQFKMRERLPQSRSTYMSLCFRCLSAVQIENVTTRHSDYHKIPKTTCPLNPFPTTSENR